MGDIDHQRGERRRYVGIEVIARFPLLARRQLIPAPQGDAMFSQTGNDGLPIAFGLPVKRREQLVAQALEQITLLVGISFEQHGHPLHEKLVEVRGEDREKLRSLQQRRAVVKRFRQNPLVDVEPT